MSLGSESVGGASSTVTVNLAGSALFPAGSCALQVTVVRPIGKVSPDRRGPHTTVRSPGGLSASVAVTSKETAAPAFEVAVRVRSAGTRMTGGVSSRDTIVTVNAPSVVSFELFVALQCTVVNPTGNVAPDAGSHETGNAPSLKSLALVSNVSVFPA